MSPRSFELDNSALALGQAIRASRLSLHMTQEEFAEKAGIHVTYVSAIELGKRNLSWTALKRISNALEIPTSKLVVMAEALEREP